MCKPIRVQQAKEVGSCPGREGEAGKQSGQAERWAVRSFPEIKAPRIRLHNGGSTPQFGGLWAKVGLNEPKKSEMK